MKKIFKFLTLLLIGIAFFVIYLSFVGFKTDKFNNQITQKVKNIDRSLEIELKEIKIILDPLKFRLTAKTIGSKLINNNKILEIGRASCRERV
mgnify:CR=1 FL=1